MKIFILVLSFQFLVFLFPIAVHAHILSTDGEVGAVMHIDPDDDPTAGKESVFYFQIKDKSNRFDFSQCECVFSIEQNGKTIVSKPFDESAGESSTLHASYIFPTKDVYTVKVIGRPISQNTFEAFELSYDIRVERLDNKVSDPTTKISQLLIPGIIAILLCIIATIFIKKIKKEFK